jgi:hypothetical protein
MPSDVFVCGFFAGIVITVATFGIALLASAETERKMEERADSERKTTEKGRD